MLSVWLLQKKKICLQNTSDGIKHLFQTDSNKTCQYLLQLCSDQHKFHLQMKARQNNQELQDLGRSGPLTGRFHGFSLAELQQRRCQSRPCGQTGCVDLSPSSAPPFV